MNICAEKNPKLFQLWNNLTKEIIRKCIYNEIDLIFFLNNVLHFANPNSSGMCNTGNYGQCLNK